MPSLQCNAAAMCLTWSGHCSSVLSELVQCTTGCKCFTSHADRWLSLLNTGLDSNLSCGAFDHQLLLSSWILTTGMETRVATLWVQNEMLGVLAVCLTAVGCCTVTQIARLTIQRGDCGVKLWPHCV